MFILIKNKKQFFNKKIKIQFQLGLTKLTPKLNLTLAPLGINVTQLLQEFNSLKYDLFDESYIINCIFLFNLNNNFFNLVVKYYHFKQLFNYFFALLKNKEEILFFLSFLKYIYNVNNISIKFTNNINKFLLFFFFNHLYILNIIKKNYNQLSSFNLVN